VVRAWGIGLGSAFKVMLLLGVPISEYNVFHLDNLRHTILVKPFDVLDALLAKLVELGLIFLFRE
jgi:hypothetical protein